MNIQMLLNIRMLLNTNVIEKTTRFQLLHSVITVINVDLHNRPLVSGVGGLVTGPHTNTKIHRCSTPLYKTVSHLHITYAQPPI